MEDSYGRLVTVLSIAKPTRKVTIGYNFHCSRHDRRLYIFRMKLTYAVGFRAGPIGGIARHNARSLDRSIQLVVRGTTEGAHRPNLSAKAAGNIAIGR